MGIQLETLISSCLEKLSAVCYPRHVIRQFPCAVKGDNVKIETFNIKSKKLAAHLKDCRQVYLFAATLGADVDRLITQRSMIDSAEAFCLQACGAAQIEDYCNNIEKEYSQNKSREGLYLRPRFSPGYGDFDINCQTEVLNLLQAHKHIGLSETNTHMLTPLKSVTALIGLSKSESACLAEKCDLCDKTDCAFRQKEASR